MRRLLAALFIVAAGFMHLPAAQAAVVSPESVTLTVVPGEKVHQTVHFENDSLDTQIYSLDLTGVSFGSSADDLRFEVLKPEQSEWIAIDHRSFVLEPGTDQAIEVTVSVPVGIDSQILSFAVVATAAADEGGGVGVTSGLASLIFIEIGGDLGTDLLIETFGTVPEHARRLPVRFAALITNRGAGLAEPEVGVVIKNLWGKETEVISLNPTGRRLPAYTNRVFTEAWQGSPWRFGPYTAELYVFPDDSDAVMTAKTSVVLFPGRMLGVFAVLGLICGGAVYALLRARRR